MQEPATCSYVLTMVTPRLCKHPDFRVDQGPTANILCSPVHTSSPGPQQVVPSAGIAEDTPGQASDGLDSSVGAPDVSHATADASGEVPSAPAEWVQGTGSLDDTAHAADDPTTASENATTADVTKTVATDNTASAQRELDDSPSSQDSIDASKQVQYTSSQQTGASDAYLQLHGSTSPHAYDMEEDAVTPAATGTDAPSAGMRLTCIPAIYFSQLELKLLYEFCMTFHYTAFWQHRVM